MQQTSQSSDMDSFFSPRRDKNHSVPALKWPFMKQSHNKMTFKLVFAFLVGLAAGQDPAVTSEQWLITLNSTIFWPSSTDYYYGPTTGPQASAVSCNAEWIEYSGRSSALMSLGATATTTSFGSYATSEGACRTSVSLEDWSDTHTGPLTTLCDEIPRALGPREIVTNYYPGTGPCITGYTTYSNVEELYREPSQKPECALQTSECIPIWETWSTLSSSWRSSIDSSTYGDTNSPMRPLDCPKTANSYPEENPCSACHFLPGTATLFYWPTSTIDGDLCLQNGTTIPASGPTTAIVNGATFTSPTVYVSFTTIYAWSNRRAHQGFQCGVDHSNAVISVNPETLSSMRHHRNAKYPTIGTAYPFNFAEFMPQQLGNETQSIIPWPQYRGGQQCPLADANSCTMIRDDYAPWLMLPEEVREIDPGWTVCDRRWYIPTVTMVALDREEITVTSTSEPTKQVEVFAAAAPEDALAAPTPQATTAGW